LGFLLYGAGFTAMVSAYKYGSVSKLQPVLSLNYVFAVLLGFCVLGESVTLHKIAGILIIAASVAAIGSSAD
jgi:undecaprenyl phosphate-alpha-L-ara4N flippase subunit ArnE